MNFFLSFDLFSPFLNTKMQKTVYENGWYQHPFCFKKIVSIVVQAKIITVTNNLKYLDLIFFSHIRSEQIFQQNTKFF